MAESLDRLSGGRLILGLGAGYSDTEFRAFGLGVPTHGEDRRAGRGTNGGRPDLVTGSLDAVVEQLAGFIDLGFSTLNLMPQGPDIVDQTELLATKVIPARRS